MIEEYSNVPIMEFGNNSRNNRYLIKEFTLPNIVPVLIDYDENRIVGEATNFKIKNKKLICDLKIDSDFSNTITLKTSFILKDGSNIRFDAKVVFLSLINDNDHLYESLNNNLKNRKLIITNWKKYLKG